MSLYRYLFHGFAVVETLVSPCASTVQGDPVRELVGKYQGEAEACKRHVLAADAVTADTRGLQQLVAAANYRAAINHTALLLEMYGQGEGRASSISVIFNFLFEV